MRLKVAIGFFFFLVVVGLVGFALIIRPAQEEKAANQSKQNRRAASGAVINNTVVLQGDNFASYYTIAYSREFILGLEAEGIGHRWIPDEADYDARVAALKSGAVKIAPMPISSYVLHGAKYGYPGIILASCSESRGADALVVKKSAFEQLSMDGLDTPGIKIALTPGSPSEDLMLLAIDTFDFQHITGNNSWLVAAEGSKDALAKLERGVVPAAVAWEPDITELLTRHPEEYLVLWSSAEFRNAIIDVYVVESNFFSQHYNDVVRFFATYFGVIDTYTSDSQRTKLIADMAGEPALALSAKRCEIFLPKVDLHSLGENCQEMFGVGSNQQAVLEGVLYWRNLYRRLGKLGPNDLENPRFIVNPSVLQELQNSPLASRGKTSVRDFKPLKDSEWAALKPAGNVRFDAVDFRSGLSSLTDDEGVKLNAVGEKLATLFQDNRVIVRGFTANENTELARERAQACADYLVQRYQLDPDRIRAEAGDQAVKPKRRMIGGTQEAFSLWKSRWSRVELTLMEADDDV